MLVVLHRSLVCLGRAPARECSQVPAFPGLRVLLARVQTILSVVEFANHCFNVREHRRADQYCDDSSRVHCKPEEVETFVSHGFVEPPKRRQRRLAQADSPVIGRNRTIRPDAYAVNRDRRLEILK